MITCVITYDIDPNRRELFDQYARNWGECSPRCGADLIGYFAPHEGSASTAYGIYSLPSLAEYEAYRSRLAADPLGRENYEFAKREGFIRSENRLFVKLASAPHGGRT
ncbi:MULTISPECIES: NIPSNAP family protein [unclassified Paracoccus (in: a-proteobacteria)]|uniref:NIPSNAP family protein n=1 Tax=unclassified Paracoccus (in: a-proteobacteria) TaxID=2688777 RepID=UPI000225F069|nr:MULTISPECIES: NIPSNAP family protein [unclassified Paracoccus (in: a-proteobacteria)]SMG10571.1 NIPSNAP protein [Paracoccus sp. J56]